MRQAFLKLTETALKVSCMRLLGFTQSKSSINERATLLVCEKKKTQTPPLFCLHPSNLYNVYSIYFKKKEIKFLFISKSIRF